VVNPSREHEMALERTYDSGVEMWNCALCGRRVMVRWGHPFNLIVLEVGDEYVAHSGSKDSIGRQAHNPMMDKEKEDPNLQPWVDWLDTVDFDSWWDKDGN